MKATSLAALLVSGILFTQTGCVGACDILDQSSLALPKGYCLELGREFSTYRLQDCGGTRTVERSIGVLEGTLVRIGWNDHVIVAWREPAWGKDAAGWMIVDLKTDRISGPIPGEGLKQLMSEDPRFIGLVTYPVGEVLR